MLQDIVLHFNDLENQTTAQTDFGEFPPQNRQNTYWEG